MKKFHVIYKEKLDEAEQLQEGIILKDFKRVYSALLEKYEISNIHTLNENEQTAFLTELSNFWVEETGITPKGIEFVKTRSNILTENSTTLQKKNYLKSKVKAIVNESIQRDGVKWKIYDIIDSMYKQIKGSGIEDILSPDMISNIIHESIQDVITEFTSNIKKELTESAKPKKQYMVKIDTRK